MEETQTSLGKEVAKSFAISAATTAGTMAAFIAVGIVVKKVQEYKARKAEEKEAE